MAFAQTQEPAFSGVLSTSENEKNLTRNIGKYKSIKFTSHADVAPGLYSVHFDLQGEKVNKFSMDFMTELGAFLEEVRALKDVQALVFFSAKENIYIAGADIDLIKTIKTADEGALLAKRAQEVIQKVEQLPFVTVAAVNGACLGGGLEFALCCKKIIASDAPSTKLGLPEVNLGVLPGMGGTVRLPKRVGLQTALDLILTGKSLNSEKAVKLGLADASLPHQNFEERVLSLMPQILEGKGPKARRKTTVASRILEETPMGRAVLFNQARKMTLAKTKGHYPAATTILEVLSQSVGLDPREALERESRAFGRLSATGVSKYLIDLFFAMEAVKKKEIKGTTGAAREIQRVGLLGAGVMGGGIAQLLAHKDYPVRMKDVGFDGLGIGMASARKLFNGLVKRKRLKPGEAEMKFLKISPTVDYSGFDHVDLVIEAVVENMEVKKAVLRETEEVLPKSAVFATNTSSLSVTQLAQGSSRPENVVGMHFFNPVHKMPLIEVIRGDKTAPDAIAQVYGLSRKLGKTPIVVKDGPGFLVNRLLMPYLNEASFLIQEGAPVETLDAAVLAFGMPMGPATLIDEVGIDVAVKVSKILHHAFGERLKPCELNEKLYASKLLGKKGSKGFYLYDPAGKQKGLNPEIYRVLGLKSKAPTDLEKGLWIDRMMLPMVNEAARCLNEGIVETAQDVDLGMILGTGFPPFRGGLLHYADEMGLEKVVTKLEGLRLQLGLRFEPCDTLRDMARNKTTFYEKFPHRA